jgi:hypothetical protein
VYSRQHVDAHAKDYDYEIRIVAEVDRASNNRQLVFPLPTDVPAFTQLQQRSHPGPFCGQNRSDKRLLWVLGALARQNPTVGL